MAARAGQDGGVALVRLAASAAAAVPPGRVPRRGRLPLVLDGQPRRAILMGLVVRVQALRHGPSGSRARSCGWNSRGHPGRRPLTSCSPASRCNAELVVDASGPALAEGSTRGQQTHRTQPHSCGAAGARESLGHVDHWLSGQPVAPCRRACRSTAPGVRPGACAPPRRACSSRRRTRWGRRHRAAPSRSVGPTRCSRRAGCRASGPRQSGCGP